MFLLNIIQIKSKIGQCRFDITMTHHVTHRNNVTSILKQMIGKTGTQQVRVITRPGTVLMGRQNRFITTGQAQGLFGITVHDRPHTLSIRKRFTMTGDKQGITPPGKCIAPKGNLPK